MTPATVPPLADLASRRLGGMVLAASDEFFAPKERLLDPSPPVLRAGRYTDRGRWVDGWETRRRRGPGHDWAVLRLALPGIVAAVVVDTTHFNGNHPAACSVDGLAAANADTERLLAASADWRELLPRTPLEPDLPQRFPVQVPLRITHLRLRLYPDGGVARLRVFGEPLPDLRRLLAPDGRADLAAAVNGATVIACSDMSFAPPGNLLLPDDAVNMSDGWETRRRRGPGHDWAVVRLAAAGTIERVEVTTTHYKGNHPESCGVEACTAPAAAGGQVPEGGWRAVVPRSRLDPHRSHVFAALPGPPATHVRLAIHPDGGVSRLRVWGRVSDEGFQRWGLRWLNALPERAAEDELLACCGSREWACRVVASRPFATAQELAGVAGKVWESLGPDEWLQAFDAHPRIGERSSSPHSSREQAGVRDADAEVLAALAEGNRAYEARFRHVFLISASGRGAAELLAELRARLDNDPETELRVAAGEQSKITRLRLERLFRP